MSPEAADNRARFLEMCKTHHLLLINTLFQKPDEKLVTYAEIGESFKPPYKRKKT